MNEILNNLVRLASLGASGISIFALFGVFYLLWKPPRNAENQWYKAVHGYMRTCIVMAVISAASGIANSMINASTISNLRQEKDTLTADLAQSNDTLQIVRTELEEKQQVLASTSNQLAAMNAKNSSLQRQLVDYTAKLKDFSATVKELSERSSAPDDVRHKLSDVTKGLDAIIKTE